MIFWQSPQDDEASSARRPCSTARAHGQVLEILIDSGEKYPYRFSGQQARTARERLACGDYAVQLAGTIVAAVERKTANDLISSMISGRMRFLMAELAGLPRAAVVVEEGYSKIFQAPPCKCLGRRRATPEIQAQFPAVPIVFCETRPLAEEWTYRWLGACQYELELAAGTSTLEETSATLWTRTPARHRFSRSRLPYVGSAGRIECAGQGTNSSRDPGGVGRKPIKSTSRAPEAARASA